jgi:lipid A 4'-phosphatase
MPRSLVLWFIALGVGLAVLFAAYLAFDIDVAAWFFDPGKGKFPVSVSYDWNLIRRVANWVPFLLLAVPIFALLRKIAFPAERMLIAPSIVIFLIGSFVLTPGLATHTLKETWGRPRPNAIQQFAGTADFQPWWRPGGTCTRNCSFVTGEASQAFWMVAPASLTPPQVRPFALGGAIVFGTAVGSLRIVFGRHFVSDVVLAGFITIAIVYALYRLLLDPARRNDARLERGIEQMSIRLHRALAAGLAATGVALADAGASLRATGQHLQRRVA